MYNNIVLNIPHARTYGIMNAKWENVSKLYREEVCKWTDWFTDELFVCPEYTQPVIFPYSRFVVDAERLIDDEMEIIGQGIIYTSFNGNERMVDTSDKVELMKLYYKHQNALRKHLDEKSIIIDCHSFPCVLNPNIDICIGFNEDWSKPSDETIDMIKTEFETRGYKVGLNQPYSNSITPETDFAYHSIMIEINKRCYMDEKTLSPNDDTYYKLKEVLKNIYRKLKAKAG